MFNFWQKSDGESRRLVIGDIHGHYDGLMELLKLVRFSDNDQLYFLGDLIDRGPKSAEVVQFVRSGHHTCIMGNHEVMLLRGYNNGQVDDRGISYWIQAGGDATLKSYGQQGIPESDLQWMANLPLYIDLGDYWLVHAGIDPYLDLNEQTSEQFCWIREKFFKADFAYFNNKTIVTGHTITFTFPGVSSGEIAVGNGWIDIETGAYHKKSGWLTALDIDNNLVYQVNVFSKKQRKKSLDKISKSIDALKVK